MLKLTAKIIFLSFFISVSSQTPTDYAKNVVTELASKEYSGRGYTNNGMGKAADYIAAQFEKTGLKKVHNSYFQEFSYPINIIESSELKINDKKLKFGEDYLINPLSPIASGKFKPLVFKSDIMDSIYVDNNYDYYYSELDKYENQAVVFPIAIFPDHYSSGGVTAKDLYKQISNAIIDNSASEKIAAVLEITDTKLTHSLSQKQSKTVGFTIKNTSITLPIETVEYDVKASFNPDFKTKNVLGMIEGQEKDSTIFITAHYDHLGKIGDTYFPGANDNASGVAFLLAMAKYFKVHKPKYTMVFVAFAGEEVGLVGSTYFVKNSPFPLKNIKYLFNFDIMGTGEDGIQIVNSTKYPKVYNALAELNVKHSLLKNIKQRGESCNSDHCPFDKAKVPSFFTYTLGGVSYYHDINDRAETLPLSKFKDILYLFTQYIESL